MAEEQLVARQLDAVGDADVADVAARAGGAPARRVTVAVPLTAGYRCLILLWPPRGIRDGTHRREQGRARIPAWLGPADAALER